MLCSLKLHIRHQVYETLIELKPQKQRSLKFSFITESLSLILMRKVIRVLLQHRCYLRLGRPKFCHSQMNTFVFF